MIADIQKETKQKIDTKLEEVKNKIQQKRQEIQQRLDDMKNKEIKQKKNVKP